MAKEQVMWWKKKMERAGQEWTLEVGIVELSLEGWERANRQRAWKEVQNSNERENKYEACVAATILACLGKTKEVIVAKHSDKSENAIKEVR